MTADTLVDLFAAAVADHPDARAVSDPTGALTYTELAARVAEEAARLRRTGVARGDVVAVQMPRGIDLVVAVLATLHAGAAYLPIDPEYPAERREHMIGIGAASASIGPDGPERLRDPGPGRGPWAGPGPDTPACLLFTSGSSGRPKGILLEHAQVAWFATTPSIPAVGPSDRVAQTSSPGFDTFTFELWRTLAGGAELVVMPSMRDLVEGDIRRELRRARITAMLAPAAVLNHVVRFEQDAFDGLRILCSGGDVLLPATCRRLREAGFTGRLFNLYGPTETTVAGTGHEVPDDVDESRPVPIGDALDGVELRVLDGSGVPVGPGEVGELYVGGSGVARGYVGAEPHDDARFSLDAGGRWFRTGDLVGARADGELEFRGRADDQVKISGVRVEPGEVERALGRHGVAEAAVTAVGDDEDRRLVAFVVLGQVESLRTLRAVLSDELPAQMVPSELVVVPAIGTDHHGKRDWTELLRDHADRAGRREERVAPRTDHEAFLADLWADLLAVEDVGATDDFFALGGHSLLAVRARSAIQKRLGISLAPEVVFEFSVLADLAEAIDHADTALSEEAPA